MTYVVNGDHTGSGTSCYGVFRDPGGTGSYTSPPTGSLGGTNYRTSTYTLCNPNSGGPITVYFTYFNLAKNNKKFPCLVQSCDVLEVWIGGSKIGSWSGCSGSPVGSTFTSSSGCITFVFKRDQVGSSSPCSALSGGGGWDATISTPMPVHAGTITGIQNICTSATTSFSASGNTGGVWASANTSIATVNNSGTVTAVGAGTTNIYYIVQDACARKDTATRTVTVTQAPSAGTIVGLNAICTNATELLSISAGSLGGTWSSSNSGVATVSTLGQVNPVSAGTATITYTATGTGGCANAVSTHAMTFTDPPDAGTISGPNALCSASSGLLSSSGQSGGTWTTTNPAIVAVDAATGAINSYFAGTATITYTANGSGGCSNTSTTHTITVSNPPVVATITGANSLCDNETLVLTASNTAGTWSSSDTNVVQVSNNGTLTPITNGTATITYAVTATSGCADALTTHAITVHPSPDAGSITGDIGLCLNEAGSLASDGTPGGTWNSSAPTILYVEESGDLTLVAPGTATVSYTVTNANSCTNVTTQLITVHPIPNTTISGLTDVCVGGQITLSAQDTGGTWLSGDTLVATIDSEGELVGLAGGTVTISYSLTNANNCSTTGELEVSVWSTDPPEINGEIASCFGSNETLSSNVSGGIWTSDNPSVLGINQNTGEVNHVTAGSANVTYTVNQAGCVATNTQEFTINPLPDPGTLTGVDQLCAKAIELITPSVLNGSWSSSNEGVATVDEYGNITAVSAGTVTITYIVSDENGCSDQVTKNISILPLPNPGILNGVDELCVGNTTLFTTNSTFLFPVTEQWESNFGDIATVDNEGVVTALSAGTTTIHYIVTDFNNCSNSATRSITVLSSNAGTISGESSVVEGYSTLFIASEPGGTWSTSNTLATVDQTGKVSAITAGKVTIYYILSNTCGTDTARADLSITTSFEDLQTPQIISPNGDGINDKWIIDFLTDYPENSVSIFNRWGTKVFSQDKYGPGTEFVGYGNVGNRTQPLPNATYFYIIDLYGNGKEVVKGYIEINR